MRSDKFSKLLMLDEIVDGKLDVEGYCSQILDKELFDFWLISMKELDNVLVMKDEASYHMNVASIRRKQYEKNN